MKTKIIRTPEEEKARWKAYRKKWYDKNKDKENQRTLAYQRKKEKEFEEWKATLKCDRCSENHPACLEFHHLDASKKHKQIADLRASPKKLKEELKKCIVLCANCHKKLHYEQKHNQDVSKQQQPKVESLLDVQ